jgi:multidrug efflux pump subunit AcrA (membrane-fusion protein)
MIAAIAMIALAACSKPAAGTAAGGAQRGQGGPGGPNGAPNGASAPGERRAAVVPVQAVVASEGLLSSDRSTAGVVSAAVQSQVASQVAGVVKSVLRVAGDWVKEGEEVVRLDDAQLKLSLATAEAALQNARINLAVGQENSDQASPKLALQLQSAKAAVDSAQKYYDAQKALFDLGGISASALDTAESQLLTAKANLEGAKSSLDQNAKSGDQTIAQLRLAVAQAQNQLAQAELNLRNASIRAPFAGQISAVNVQAGMYAGVNASAFTLVSAERRITFNIAPSDAPALPVGTPLSFAYNGKAYPIMVRQAPSAPIGGTVPMSASAPASLELPFGAVGSVSYEVAVARGVLVPLGALGTLENRNYVFCVEDGKAVMRDVAIVGEAGATAAVSGIASGSVIVVNPPPGLIQGAAVQAIMAGGKAGKP